MGDEKVAGRRSSYCSESSQKGQDKLTVYEDKPIDAETKAVVKVDIVLVMHDKELLESGKT